MKVKTQKFDEIKLFKGQVIKIDGLPFKLKEDTVVLGRQKNMKLIRPEVLKNGT